MGGEFTNIDGSYKGPTSQYYMGPTVFTIFMWAPICLS